MNRSLDGLRAFAVAAVMLFHCGAPGSSVGWLGVDLFFVLSGFLITTLLLRERAACGRISLRLFWARRFLRLMPVYVLYISVITALVAFGLLGTSQPHGAWTPTLFVGSLWTYLHNLAPQGGVWSEQQLTRHLWSLSVEEQFYFVWPVLMAVVARRRRLEILAGGLVVAVCAVNLFAYGLAPPKLLLHTRGIGLFVGCLAAILLHGRSDLLRRLGLISRRATWVSAVAAVACVAVMEVFEERDHVGEATWLATGVPCFAVAVALLIANLWVDQDSRLARFLSLRPLPRIGAISYGVYLYHMAVLEVVWTGLLPGIEHWSRYPKFALRVVVFFALTGAVAYASYRLIEEPFLRMKGRFRPQPAAADG